jgi:Tfp pilus assembly protein PilF
MRLLSEIRNYMGNYQLKSGLYHFYRSEFSQAVGFLSKAIADPSKLSEGDQANARCYLTRSLKGLGEKLAAEGKTEEGVEQLRRAVDVDASYPDIHFVTAGLLERLGRRDEAIEAYRRAIACHADYLDAHVSLGNCLIDAGRCGEASEVFRRAMQLKVEQTQGPFRNGIEQLEAGRPDAARECFHQAFMSMPRLATAYLEESLEWLRAEEYERALEGLDRALELNPKYPDLHNFRGIALCELDRYEESVAAFRRSAELCPDHLVPRLNLAFAFLRAGRQSEGEAELLSILDRDRDQPVARAKLEELRSVRIPDKRGMGARS